MKNKEKYKRRFIKELNEKYNCSWARFLITVAEERNCMDKPAIFYRGNRITFKEMFDKAFEVAKSMKALGIEKGMEIPMCLSNCPETIYTLLGASLIGAKINVFGLFDEDYVKEIINDTDAKVLFVTDDQYEGLKKIIPDTNIDKVVMYSITDSYPNGKNPYYELEKDFYDNKNRVPEYKKEDDNILNKQEFINLGKEYTGVVEEKSTLDDIFSITYSSGSTNAHRPKAIKHRVTSFNAMGMAHNGGDTPKMKNLRTLVQIPTHSNTCLISSISDTLSQGCTCALEYIYNEYFFLKSLLINKPNLAEATRCFWIRAWKESDSNPEYKNIKLPFLLAPFAVGEPTSPGEEKYFNKHLRKYKAGTDFIPTPVSVITMSMGGGDCEHGGIFINMFKSLTEKKPQYLIFGEPVGYHSYKMVDYAVLNKDGKECKPYEYGTLVADSLCNMAGYKNNEEATNNFYITDEFGDKRASCNTYSYLDRFNGIHIKGRIPDKNTDFPLFLIQDIILEDTKNILSCEVVELPDKTIIAHIEQEPDSKIELKHLLFSIQSRLMREIPENIENRIVFKFRSYDESYPLTNCGKRSAEKLKAEGLEGSICLIVNPYNALELMDGAEYIKATTEDVKTLTLNK